jgi:hypothetical protein
MSVTQAWPSLIRLPGGCSLCLMSGMIHETAGSVPSFTDE